MVTLKYASSKIPLNITGTKDIGASSISLQVTYTVIYYILICCIKDTFFGVNLEHV